MKEKYQLIVYFNEYTRNFHREFNAHVFAYDSQTHDWVAALADKANKELGGDDVVEDWQFNYLDMINDEYGSNISALTHFKGEGVGTNAITVFFIIDPTPILPVIFERMRTFPKALAKSWEFAPKKVKIEKVELMKQTITETTKQLDF